MVEISIFERGRGQHGKNILWPPDNIEALKEMLARGVSYTRMADDLNSRFKTDYTRSAIAGKVRRLGLSAPSAVIRSPAEIQARRRARQDRQNLRRRENRASAPKPRVALPPREETKLLCAGIDPLHIELMDLGKNQCRYPYGDGPFTFCGHPKVFGSYCGPHFFLTCGRGLARENAPISERQFQGTW